MKLLNGIKVIGYSPVFYISHCDYRTHLHFLLELHLH